MTAGRTIWWLCGVKKNALKALTGPRAFFGSVFTPVDALRPLAPDNRDDSSYRANGADEARGDRIGDSS